LLQFADRATHRAYLDIAGHGDQLDALLFRPLRGNAKPLNAAGRMDPGAIDRMVVGRPSDVKLHGKKREHGLDSGDCDLASGRYVPTPARTACLLRAIMACKKS
jgi:hypothetical protein